MDENVFAGLAADEAVAFGVVKPLYCSLFCHGVRCSFVCESILRCRDSEVLREVLAVEARTAHFRLGLTYICIVRGWEEISKWECECLTHLSRASLDPFGFALSKIPTSGPKNARNGAPASVER